MPEVLTRLARRIDKTRSIHSTTSSTEEGNPRVRAYYEKCRLQNRESYDLHSDFSKWIPDNASLRNLLRQGLFVSSIALMHSSQARAINPSRTTQHNTAGHRACSASLSQRVAFARPAVVQRRGAGQKRYSSGECISSLLAPPPHPHTLKAFT